MTSTTTITILDPTGEQQPAPGALTERPASLVNELLFTTNYGRWSERLFALWRETPHRVSVLRGR